MSGILDALVIGGGPAGSTAAVLLARAGWSVGIVEKSTFPRPKVCGEFISASNLPLMQHLGVAETFEEIAGPPVRQVGLFAGEQALVSDMPTPRIPAGESGERRAAWGRALGRDRLDAMLLERAVAAGAQMWQPWSATSVERYKDGYACTLSSRDQTQSRTLQAMVVIGANGSWEPGPLPSQRKKSRAKPPDLLAFKAHFLDSRLPEGLMPLLAFPGGYGGMAQCDDGRVSLSCCVRRDTLESARHAGPQRAAEALLAHIKRSCRPVAEVLEGARIERGWLSAGPIRPGMRGTGSDGLFLIGNAAGEAHPVIAEGIGMAMQSARLLSDSLCKLAPGDFSEAALDAARHEYAAAWRRILAPRVRVAAVIAHWAMRPAAVRGTLPILKRFPAMLTAGARFSGKAALAEAGT